MRWIKIIFSCAFLSACVQSEPCASIELKTWSHDQQQEILSQEKKLSSDNILITVLLDYIKTRREIEAANDNLH